MNPDVTFVVARWLVKPGDKVEPGKLLAEVESSDDLGFEVEVRVAGTVSELLTSLGAPLRLDSALIRLDVGNNVIVDAGFFSLDETRGMRAAYTETAQKARALAKGASRRRAPVGVMEDPNVANKYIGFGCLLPAVIVLIVGVLAAIDAQTPESQAGFERIRNRSICEEYFGRGRC